MNQLLVLAAVIAVLVVWSKIQKAPEAERKKLVRQGLIWGAVGLVVILALLGKLNPLIAAGAALVPLLQRGLTAWKVVNTLRGGGGSGPSAKGRFVAIELADAQGNLDGTILDGPHKGARLSQLPVEQLVELVARYGREDPRSQALLAAYLDYRDPQWRARTGYAGNEGGRQMADTAMSRAEACEVLGVRDDATPEEITDAHRRLMQKLHPDRGGSDYLAAKVNLAKKTLMPRAKA